MGEIIRELTLDANKIEQMLKYRKASLGGRGVNTTKTLKNRILQPSVPTLLSPTVAFPGSRSVVTIEEAGGNRINDEQDPGEKRRVHESL